MRWEVSGRTSAVLWDVASSICLREHTVFLDSSNLVFSLCVSLLSMWYIHIILSTQIRLGRYSDLFYRMDHISI